MPRLDAIQTPRRGVRNLERFETRDVGHLAWIAESTIRIAAGTASLSPFA